jgi:hypothetical protein
LGLRVSEHFNLGLKQPSLSFVDVDTSGDVRLFISPRALRLLPSAWGDECVALIQSFFNQVLHAIKAGDDSRAIRLLEVLKEPNETHLGLSKGGSRGRGLGSGSARDVWHALTESAAAKSGLLTDLEDTVLMIEGISVDIVSDVVTNIIRGPSRGQFGIIVCRKIADRAKFVERCRDTAKDHRGYVIALEDADLIRLTEDVKGCLDFFELPLLKERFDRLVF